MEAGLDKNNPDQEKKKALKINVDELQSQLQSLLETRDKNPAMSPFAKIIEANSAPEAMFQAERAKFEEVERQANAQLAEALERLKRTNGKEDIAAQVVYSLDLVIKALGRITTVFSKTQAFWLRVKFHCNHLMKDGKDMADNVDDEEMLTELPPIRGIRGWH